MNLIVKATAEKPIIVEGLNVEVKDVFVGIEFSGLMDGKSMKIGFRTFASEEQAMKGQPLFTDIPQVTFEARLEENESQDRETALAYAKRAFDQMGYESMIAKPIEVKEA